mmetsp:Transcript_8772/g.32450  ORF Transcript_8772/g.32450 Transcript_8772/m.32450 type:complete len:359 (+) Transcript_8772:2742-3818(+)
MISQKRMNAIPKDAILTSTLLATSSITHSLVNIFVLGCGELLDIFHGESTSILLTSHKVLWKHALTLHETSCVSIEGLLRIQSLPATPALIICTASEMTCNGGPVSHFVLGNECIETAILLLGPWLLGDIWIEHIVPSLSTLHIGTSLNVFANLGPVSLTVRVYCKHQFLVLKQIPLPVLNLWIDGLHPSMETLLSSSTSHMTSHLLPIVLAVPLHSQSEHFVILSSPFTLEHLGVERPLVSTEAVEGTSIGAQFFCHFVPMVSVILFGELSQFEILILGPVARILLQHIFVTMFALLFRTETSLLALIVVTCDLVPRKCVDMRNLLDFCCTECVEVFHFLSKLSCRAWPSVKHVALS